jgi:outer membrane protein OmpA-like peptidoglycan-associated protein
MALMVSFVSACAATRPAEPWRCALVGAGVGGLGGATVGATTADEDNDTTDASLIGAGIGAATGALVGYSICAAMPESVPAPPPAPPAARPAPVVQKTVVLPGVSFAFNSAELLPGAMAILDREVIPELNADPDLQVLIEGHTDSVGSDEYNEKLSGQRAGSVWRYLVSKGISSSRLQAKGLGESDPVASNDTAEGRAKNRRVNIMQLK